MADSKTKPKPANYNWGSRVVDRRFAFGDEEREVFRMVLQMIENFSGCRVLYYCVILNHFHILLENREWGVCRGTGEVFREEEGWTATNAREREGCGGGAVEYERSACEDWVEYIIGTQQLTEGSTQKNDGCESALAKNAFRHLNLPAPNVSAKKSF